MFMVHSLFLLMLMNGHTCICGVDMYIITQFALVVLAGFFSGSVRLT